MIFMEKFRVRNLRCLAWFDNTVYIIPTSDTLAVYLMQTKYNMGYLFKVKCRLEKIDHNMSNVYVALIDLTNFNDPFNQLKYIQFHKPAVFNANKAKKKSIVNCVHTVSILDAKKEKNMVNWIQFQQKIGYDKVVMYFMDVSANFSNFLVKKFGSFVQIIDHETSESRVCGWHRKMLSINPSNLFSQALMEHCLRSIKVNFGIEDQYVKNSHERLCTNDCLMKSKFEYEYLTNFDFDEFIFPRMYHTKRVTELTTDQNCTGKIFSQKANMYQYVKRLESIYGNNIAIDNLNIKLAVNSYTDKFYISSYRKNKDYFECMNSTIMKNNCLSSKWNNYLGVLVNNRYGKSIYNTNLTLSYNQHHSSYIKWNSFRVTVSLYHGFVSHFRDTELGWKKRYSVQNLFIDSEYYENKLFTLNTVQIKTNLFAFCSSTLPLPFLDSFFSSTLPKGKVEETIGKKTIGFVYLQNESE
ncbi:hypothetical protein BpHYR1_000760 [Brachionus plicatilis]|uniref:Glycosyltransferase family 92 protein n=1 Tax=Brachionus plicatilis TaxID=10195 RepID=A0A3M7RTQ9_BRAPC|nr:hypothetical protein BpHYR1_000760 [Brachionus plicatilis]